MKNVGDRSSRALRALRGLLRARATFAAVTVVLVAVTGSLIAGGVSAEHRLPPRRESTTRVSGPPIFTTGVAPKAAEAYPVVAGIVPWIDTAPVPSPVAAPPASCRRSSLLVSLDLEGAGGWGVGSLGLENIGSTPCAVSGGPTLTLLNPSATDQEGSYGQASLMFSPDHPRPPTWPVVVLDPARKASAVIYWMNWCGRSSPRWRIWLDGTGTLAMDSGGGRCDSPESNYGVTVSVFLPVPTTRQRHGLGSVDLAFAPPAVPGQPWRYEITLTNIYSHSMRLDPCPTYAERLKVKGGTLVSRTYVLNCEGLLIPARTSIVFEMFLDVPPDAPLGPAELFWAFDPPNEYPAPIDVTIGLARSRGVI
jgi:hypothetical protein